LRVLLQRNRLEGLGIVKTVLLNQPVQVHAQRLLGGGGLVRGIRLAQLRDHRRGEFRFDVRQGRIGGGLERGNHVGRLAHFLRLQRAVLQGGCDQFRREEADAPEPHHAGEAETDANNQVMAPARMPDQIRDGTHLLGRPTLGRFRLGFLPRLRLPEEHENGYAEENRRQADEEQYLPAAPPAPEILRARRDAVA